MFSPIQFCAAPRCAHNWLTRPQRGGEPVSIVSFPHPDPKIAHRATQGRVWDSLPFSGVLLLGQSCQVLLQLAINCLLDGANSKSQCPVPHLARFSAHLGWFHINEPFVLQLPNILCNRVGAHSSGLANAPDAGPTLMRFPVLAENQVGINRQFARD